VIAHKKDKRCGVQAITIVVKMVKAQKVVRPRTRKNYCYDLHTVQVIRYFYFIYDLIMGHSFKINCSN
jgi:hypothetical protein